MRAIVDMWRRKIVIEERKAVDEKIDKEIVYIEIVSIETEIIVDVD